MTAAELLSHYIDSIFEYNVVFPDDAIAAMVKYAEEKDKEIAELREGNSQASIEYGRLAAAKNEEIAALKAELRVTEELLEICERCHDTYIKE
jgi:hypothetical protein